MPDWSLSDRPNRVPWPPILLASAVGGGLLLHAVAPLSLPASPLMRGAGLALVVAALAVDVWAAMVFRRARTTILPHRGTEALVTDGPFALSRNPIYAGNVALVAGVGLGAGSWWPIILAPLMAVAVDRLAIRREEAHLAARFGPAWQAYAGRVRRWL